MIDVIIAGLTQPVSAEDKQMGLIARPPPSRLLEPMTADQIVNVIINSELPPASLHSLQYILQTLFVPKLTAHILVIKKSDSNSVPIQNIQPVVSRQSLRVPRKGPTRRLFMQSGPSARKAFLSRPTFEYLYRYFPCFEYRAIPILPTLRVS
jgi:hypothetical protein